MSTAAPITESTTALPLRSYTILGVCEAIGEDFGINPLFLRVPLAAIVVVSVQWAVIAYLALGVVVLASRLLFPRPKLAAVNDAPVIVPANSQADERLAA